MNCIADLEVQFFFFVFLFYLYCSGEMFLISSAYQNEQQIDNYMKNIVYIYNTTVRNVYE